MSTFPYAFPKMMVLNGTVKTTGDSSNLTAGDFGLYSKKTNEVVTSSNASSHPYVYAAQGSFYTVDSIGKSPLSGLKTSIKTAGINAKYVTKFYKKSSKTPKNHIIQVGLNSSTLNFEANKTYQLRVDAKGSDALRLLTRNMYKHVPYFTGCSSNECLTGCEKEYVDPVSVMYGWAAYINADPLLSQLILATPYKVAATSTYTNSAADTSIVVAERTGIVAGQLVQGAGIAVGTKVAAGYTPNTGSGAVILDTASAIKASPTAIVFSNEVTSSYSASANSTTAFATPTFLVISGAYIDTVFSNCSFSPVDFYQKDPLIIYATLVDADGNPCSDGPKINSNVLENTVELQSPVTPEGLGETVIREYMLSREYEGIHFQRDPRYREVEKDPIFDNVSRTGYYTRYYLQFHVPVFSNPNNAFTSNQYLVCFTFPSGTSTSDFETLMNAWLTANNPEVSLETIV